MYQQYSKETVFNRYEFLYVMQIYISIVPGVSSAVLNMLMHYVR
jgi:hypothetical protein